MFLFKDLIGNFQVGILQRESAPIFLLLQNKHRLLEILKCNLNRWNAYEICFFFTSLCGKCAVSIKLFPNTIGINKKQVTRNTHPETTPNASGLEKNKTQCNIDLCSNEKALIAHILRLFPKWYECLFIYIGYLLAVWKWYQT